jgi:hypothetical protein
MVAATKADRRTMRASASDVSKKTVTETEPNWVNPFAAAVAVQSRAADGGDADDEADGNDSEVSLYEQED